MNLTECIKNNQDAIILFAGFILVFVFGFFSGYFYLDEQNKKENISIEEPSGECLSLFNKPDIIDTRLITVNQNEKTTANNIATRETKKEMLYVASKNGKVYHKPDCAFAKKIKEENRIWFSSEEEGKEKGYSRHEQCFK